MTQNTGKVPERLYVQIASAFQPPETCSFGFGDHPVSKHFTSMLGKETMTWGLLQDVKLYINMWVKVLFLSMTDTTCHNVPKFISHFVKVCINGTFSKVCWFVVLVNILVWLVIIPWAPHIKNWASTLYVRAAVGPPLADLCRPV